MRKFIGLLLVCTFFIASPSSAKFADLAERLLPTTVKVIIDGTNHGSGVFISTTGTVLTAAHLFKDDLDLGFLLGILSAEPKTPRIDIWLYPGNIGYQMELIRKDRKADLAILKPITPITHSSATITLSKKVRVGEEVLSIGNPLKYDWSVTAGIVSHVDRRNTRVSGILQSDVSTNPGNSGGPLFNVAGELVGIASMITTDGGLFSGISLFVNLRTIRKFLKEK